MTRRLEEIYVFITENAGDEGVAAFRDPRRNQLVPMVAATEEKLEELTMIAQELVSFDPSKPMRIVRFWQREDIAEIVPAPADATATEET